MRHRLTNSRDNVAMSVVVFDVDGTLTDSEAIWDEVRRGMAADDGVAWPPDATTAMMGMSTQEWSTYLVQTVGLPGTAEQAAERTISALRDHYRLHGAPELPGASAAVRRMAAQWTVGLASSSPRVLIDTIIEQLAIGDLVTTSVSTEEIGGVGKPAPDVYLEVCRRLNADPARSIAIEDAPNGIRSAHAAGMKVIAVPPHFHPPTADVLSLAHLVIDSLEELSVDRIAALLEA